MDYLVTRCYHIPKIHNKQQASEFFLSVKKPRTLELVVENVLRRNDVSVSLLSLDTALFNVKEGDYPDIVKVFLESAIEHRERIFKEMRFEDLREMWASFEGESDVSYDGSDA